MTVLSVADERRGQLPAHPRGVDRRADRRRWATVCAYDTLQPERGAAALVGTCQVALFRTHSGAVFAVGNQDPFSGTHVLARGIVGTRGDVPTVASPMHKQVFNLETGECLDDAQARIPVYAARVRNGMVEVRIP